MNKETPAALVLLSFIGLFLSGCVTTGSPTASTGADNISCNDRQAQCQQQANAAMLTPSPYNANYWTSLNHSQQVMAG